MHKIYKTQRRKELIMANDKYSVTGIRSENVDWFHKVKKDDNKPQGLSAGAHMACNNIGNYLNGTTAYS